MAETVIAQNPAAVAIGDATRLHADPATGGLAVALVGVGPAITIGTVDQGAPNAGGGQSWPVVDRASGATGVAHPAWAIQVGFTSAGGNLVGVTLGQALSAASVPVVIPAVQNAVGATGAAVPSNAIYLGATNGGNLTGCTIGSNSGLETQETLAPQAEDNTNGVYAMAIKPLATNTYAPSLFTNFGANTTLNVKASAGNVLALWCSNANAAVRYIQVHNTATTPGAGAVPLLSFAIPALTGQTVIGADALTFSGAYFSTGIAFAVSTTLATYTAATAADHNTQVMYK